MNKCFKYIIISLVVLIIPSLLYIYSSNSSLQSQIENNDKMREQIIYFDEFNSDINKMSLANKYYLITNDDSYKTSYNISEQNALDSLKTLYDKNYISSEKKNLLEDYISDLNTLSNEAKKSSDSLQYSKEDLTEIIKIENKIIDITSENLNENIKNSNSNSGNAINIVNNQNSVIEVLGGFFTMIFLTPIYFLSKNINIVNDAIKNFFSSIKNKTHVESSANILNEKNCSDELMKCINSGMINNLNEKISEREIMVSTLKIIYSHCISMSKEYERGYIILKSIDQDLINLRIELSRFMNDSYIPYDKLNIIENKFLETRFLLERLPQYNEFIISLTKKY